MFAKFDVPSAGYVVNRVLPETLRDQNPPPYLVNRMKMQQKYLDRIRGEFGDQVLARVPELERDVTGLEMIERVATIMYGG
jgi:anion-transporting  ArsA/GET3 family ATPase